MKNCPYCNKDLSNCKTGSSMIRNHLNQCAAKPIYISNTLKLCCSICTKEMQYGTFESHLSTHHTVKSMCKECNTPLYSFKSFCDQSCSAKFNNARKDYSVIKTGPKKGTKPKRSSKTFCKVSWCEICKAMIENKHLKTCSSKCKNTLISNKIHSLIGSGKMIPKSNFKSFGWYESPIAGKVHLDSTYEHIVAQDLDKHNIKWSRPSFLPYTLNGKSRKYFPDFYLEDYDVYLDPKNSYLIKLDKDKIEAASNQNNKRVIILEKHELSVEAILDRINLY